MSIHRRTDPDAREATRVLSVNTDPDMLALLQEWLGCARCAVVGEHDEAAAGPFDLVVIDVPFPRRGGLHLLERIREEHPDASLLVMSSSFFHDVKSDGGVARALKVDAVLPKPFTRDALFKAIERFA